MIADRRAANTRRDDLLAMLLDARDDDGEAAMTGRQIREEAMTLLLAGHETMANTLAWAWYLLGRNPAAEARLYEEVDRVLGGRRSTTCLGSSMPGRSSPRPSASIRRRTRSGGRQARRARSAATRCRGGRRS